MGVTAWQLSIALSRALTPPKCAIVWLNGRRTQSGPAQEVPRETPEEEARTRGLNQLIPDLVRRTFYAGLGAVFTTEGHPQALASEFHLPKDVASFLITQAASSKDELFRVFARELRSFLESMNVSGELQKLLTSLSFEVKTEIRFIPNDEAVGGIKPEFKKKMAVKRTAGSRVALLIFRSLFSLFLVFYFLPDAAPREVVAFLMMTGVRGTSCSPVGVAPICCSSVTGSHCPKMECFPVSQGASFSMIMNCWCWGRGWPSPAGRPCPS